ncbi:DNA polymerase III subunit epsilon [Aquimonas voraii]|uniref:DNA polymerase III subunit epsilon n=1 Tax=Aquimonas voraii TaxID=265719 RepID=A0A1G6RYV6_9GAMM|nr:DNA polymerase III subunit epsilon [Aquimonas voraii]SDD09136.1 DNA polymerase-3 subunit epsilon [Aquimonas voraii]
MRQVVLDTETTGMPVERGHRIIEIGAVEIINRRLTGRTFHHYIHPEREIDEGAQAVHGISLEFLEGKPRFAGIADELIEFLRGAELIAHNAAFDVGFLNAELARLPNTPSVRDLAIVTDTLAMARERYPGQRNSLDALCKRLGVDNGHRNLHGALLDAELLADVYLAMTSGQTDLGLAVAAESAAAASARRVSFDPGQLRVVAASEDDLQAHRAWVDKLRGASGGRSLWPEAAEA